MRFEVSEHLLFTQIREPVFSGNWRSLDLAKEETGSQQDNVLLGAG